MPRLLQHDYDHVWPAADNWGEPGHATDALLAQGQIDDYLESVNKVSGTIGTALSRFQIAAHVASSVADVSQAAEARITDADVAENAAALVRNQILPAGIIGHPRPGEPTTRVGSDSATRLG